MIEEEFEQKERFAPEFSASSWLIAAGPSFVACQEGIIEEGFEQEGFEQERFEQERFVDFFATSSLLAAAGPLVVA